MKYRVIGFGLLIVLLGAGVCTAQDAETLKRAAVYEPLMVAAGKRYGVDPRLLWTVAFLETRFRPDQVSRAGARGMMQFMPMTAARFGLSDPHNPAASINAAARYLRELQTMFDRRLDLILAAYNAGEHAVTAFRDGRRLVLSNGKILNPNGIGTGGVPPYRETYGYVRSGIGVYLGLAMRKELVSINHSILKLPKKIDLEKPAGPAPEEITELKQGSIYVIKEAASNNPILPQNSTTRSVYPQ